jgi:hypothetical protein
MSKNKNKDKDKNKQAATLAKSAAKILAIHQSNLTPAEKQSVLQSQGFTPVVTGGQSVARQSTQQPSSDFDSFQPGGTVATGDIPPGLVNTPMYDAAKEAAQLQIQRQIEELRQFGQTERQKLVNENNLAVTGMEVKGKLDLQGIVNAGYKNIANIERGTEMVRNITSMFNF